MGSLRTLQQGRTCRDCGGRFPLSEIVFVNDGFGAVIKTTDGTYVMSGSDFLQSFAGRMTRAERMFLGDLFDQDWTWVDRYIEVTERLRHSRERLGA